jgi:hypothetical protein
MEHFWQVSLAFFYLLIAYFLFKAWLGFFLRDTSLTRRQRNVQLGLLIGITILWPLIVPFAYLELLSKIETKKLVIASDLEEADPCDLDEADACDLEGKTDMSLD